MEDTLFIQLFVKGDLKAFSSIYNKYVDELFAYGTNLGFEREVIKDAIQDTFLKFYLNRNQLKAIVSLKYYLYRMLKNRLLDIYKSTYKEKDMDPAGLPFLVEASIMDTIIEEEDRKLLEQRVNNLLKVLTDRQKEAVYLRFIQGMEYEEVGDLLEMTPPAVRKLVSRAIKRMREDFFRENGNKINRRSSYTMNTNPKICQTGGCKGIQ